VDEMMQIRFRTVAGFRIRYAESGGRSGQTILLTSPWPESVYAFEPIWSSLADRAALLAVDLPGFGGSERSDELMSPHAMGEFLVQLIDEFGLGNPHLVGPDVGTSAALLAAAGRPGLLSSLVAGSGGAAVPIRLGGALEDWVLAPDIDRFRAIDPRAIVGAALDTIAGHTLPAEVREDYLRSYEGDRFVESMRYVRTISTPIGRYGAATAAHAEPAIRSQNHRSHASQEHEYGPTRSSRAPRMPRNPRLRMRRQVMVLVERKRGTAHPAESSKTRRVNRSRRELCLFVRAVLARRRLTAASAQYSTGRDPPQIIARDPSVPARVV
jgi:pimeloyl-ACP methyl ester carboxylesterase